MPSFDIVSEVNMHEVTNAVDQANRELSTRFDFKDAEATITQAEAHLNLEAENEFQLQQMTDILHKKLAKRGVDITALEAGQIEVQNRRARLTLQVKQGIETVTAKKLVKLIKDSKVKVQASIQGEQVRVSGKKRDDLQHTIAMLKEQDIGLPLQFTNFRD